MYILSKAINGNSTAVSPAYGLSHGCPQGDILSPYISIEFAFSTACTFTMENTHYSSPVLSSVLMGLFMQPYDCPSASEGNLKYICDPFIQMSLTNMEITVWITNYIHIKLQEVITHPCLHGVINHRNPRKASPMSLQFWSREIGTQPQDFAGSHRPFIIILCSQWKHIESFSSHWNT